MRTRVLGSVHKTGGTRPGFSHPALMVAMEGVKVAGFVAGKDRGAKVARLLKIVYTCVGWYIHACPPGELIELMLHYMREELPLVTIEQSKQQTEDKMTDDILEKGGPGGEFGQFPTPGQRVIFIDKWSQPPRRGQKQFPKNGPFEPVWARQEPFEDRRIQFCQDDAIEEMKTPSQQSNLLLSWRFPSEEALNKADITVPIAGERHIHFHDE